MNENPKEHEHWQGTKNKLIRYYFYINTGLNVFNNFKYLAAAIFGIYWTMHLKNPAWLLIMGFVSIPVLGVIGYYSIHHINKIIDWLNVKFGSHYSIASFELQKDIRDGIKELVEQNKKTNS